jgi:D-alanine-D-alanine ligase
LSGIGRKYKINKVEKGYLRMKEVAALTRLGRRIGKRKIFVLMGGMSAEREISLITGQAIFRALRAQKLNVKAFDIRSQEDILQVIRQKPAVVVNGLHGPGGEDGVLQGILEWFGIPFTGSGLMASALAMNKHLAKQVMLSAGLPTAPWICLPPGGALPARIKLPVVVKPIRQGSAIGVSIVRRRQDLPKACAQARQYGKEIMLEQYVAGKEISVGVLQGKALPVIEIVPKKEFYDYEAKYVEGMSEHILPARLPASRAKKVQNLAARASQALGCKGASRIDMIVTPAGEVNILEVNTLPGMTSTSLLPEAARQIGISFAELVARLVIEAWEERA